MNEVSENRIRTRLTLLGPCVAALILLTFVLGSSASVAAASEEEEAWACIPEFGIECEEGEEEEEEAEACIPEFGACEEEEEAEACIAEFGACEEEDVCATAPLECEGIGVSDQPAPTGSSGVQSVAVVAATSGATALAPRRSCRKGKVRSGKRCRRKGAAVASTHRHR